MAAQGDGATGWFAGPKAENADWFEALLTRIVQDYYSWRRNYFPEDGFIVDSRTRHGSESFRDEFEDRLMELLARLKADFPFHSPRYAAHMIAEQSLPSIAGYFAAMLYNPNNVSREAAPVTVRLELEACRMIGKMLGYGQGGWGHLTGGGTVANIEALWVARTVAYLPQAIRQMRAALKLPNADLVAEPQAALLAFSQVFDQGQAAGATFQEVLATYLRSDFCVVQRGLNKVASLDGRQPFVLVPETHHYCFEKAVDILGLGRDGLISVAVDSDFRMKIDDLEAKLVDLEHSGGRALAVVAVVGSTEEGAIDPVDRIVKLRRAREAEGLDSFWLQIDGTYGGYLRTMTTPNRIGLGEPSTRVRIAGVDVQVPLSLPELSTCDALDAIGEADSVTIDPHKLGYIPYPAGAICFKSDLVKPLVRQEAPYIGEEAGEPNVERNVEGVGLYILEGSKPGAAAAAVWLSHSLIRLDSSGHGKLVQQTVRNACEMHSLLALWPELHQSATVQAVPLTEPASNILCFAFRPRGANVSLASINELNRTVYGAFTVEEGSGRRMYDQRFFVSRTTLRKTQYRYATVAPFLTRLGVERAEYEREGVFLLRCVLMNPWYEHAKSKGRYFLVELVESLFESASQAI